MPDRRSPKDLLRELDAKLPAVRQLPSGDGEPACGSSGNDSHPALMIRPYARATWRRTRSTSTRPGCGPAAPT